jgi:hypothetical protein
MSEHINDDVLRSVLEADEEVMINENLKSHVEQCERCRARLEELAASRDEWSDAADSLNGVGSLSVAAVRDSRSAKIGPDVWRDYPMEWTESMAKQLLDAPSHPEMLGRIGRYEVERLLGAGGMGIVFKAYDTELSRPVAIKLLAPHLAASGAGRKRFSREAKAAAAIVHEHVVPIYNVETEQEKPYMVMHFVAGESLQTRLDREGPLELCEILRIARQIAAGLAAAHAQGLVHRDIKPSNVLLEKGIERALLTDFGLARAADDASLTRTGFHPGTPQYMSPEQACGDSVDARSDLFSLGSVLYVMCTGRAPFRADSSLGILRKITDSEPVPIREINPAVPEWLEGLVEKLMAKRIEDRFQSAAEVATIFEECLAHVQEPLRHALPKRCHRTFLQKLFQSRRLRLIMNETRVLSIMGLVLFLAAILVPFLLAGVAVREEHLLLFAAVAFGFAVIFAVISRKELFSRIVLIISGAVLVGGLLGAIVMVPWLGYRRSQAMSQEMMAERRQLEYEVAALQDGQVAYGDGAVGSVGRAEWEKEYVAAVEEGVAQKESYPEMVERLRKLTNVQASRMRKSTSHQLMSRSLQLETFSERELARDADGKVLFQFPAGFLSSLSSEQRVAIADALGDIPVAFATMQVTPFVINSAQGLPSFGASPSSGGQESEVSALRIIVFFDSEGKSVAFGMDGVYVHAGVGREKKAKEKEAEIDGVEEAGERMPLSEGADSGSSKLGDGVEVPQPFEETSSSGDTP